MTRLRVKSWIVKSSGVQSPRPRGRTRRFDGGKQGKEIMFQSPCPRVMTRPAKPKSKIRRLQFQSLQSRTLAISQSRCKRRESGKSKQGRKSARRRPQSEVRYGCTTRGSLSMQEECPCILSSQRRSKGHWTQWNKQHPGLPGKTDALLSRYRFFRII